MRESLALILLLLGLSVSGTAIGQINLRLAVECTPCRDEPYSNYLVSGSTCRIGLKGPGGIEYRSTMTNHYQRSNSEACENWKGHIESASRLRFRSETASLDDLYSVRFVILQDGCINNGWDCFSRHTFLLEGWDTTIEGDRGFRYAARSPFAVLDYQKVLSNFSSALMQRVDR